LSTTEVGRFNLSFTVAGLIGLIVLFGMDRAVVRYVASYWSRGERSRELGITVSSITLLLLLIVVITPTFWLGADTIAQTVFQKPELTPVLRAFILSVPFVALTRLLMGILQGYKWMKPIVLIEQIGVPTLRIIGILVIILAFDQTSVLASYSFLIASVIGCIAAVKVTWRFLLSRKEGKGLTSLYSELLQYSWPLFGASILNRTNTYTETLILGAVSSTQQVGIFTVSFKIAFTLTMIFQSINSILAPFIAEVYAHSDTQQLAQQFKAVTRWILTLTLPIALVTFLEASDIMAVLKPEYIAGAPILQILTVSYLISVAVGPVAILLTMTRYARLNLLDLFLTLILSLLLDFTLIPRHGAIGAAISGAVAMTFLSILRLIQIYLAFGIHPYSWSIFKPIVAGGIATLIGLTGHQLLRNFSPGWRLVAFSIVLFFTYGSAVVALGQDEIDNEVIDVLLKDLTLSK
jgi:O-antigen/teichoic acid export membrane protein